MKKYLVLVILACNFVFSTAAKERLALTKKVQTEVINALKVNEDLHASFFSYDGKNVELFAKKLNKSISNISDKKLVKLLKFAQGKLSDIKSSNDKDVNGQNYHIVSMALIHIINTYNVGPGYNAYSCPMVKKKWVQNSTKDSKVNNPYAAMMPHCGSKDSKF